MIVYINKKPFEIIEPAEYGICFSGPETDNSIRKLAVDIYGRLRILIEYEDGWDFSTWDPFR